MAWSATKIGASIVGAATVIGAAAAVYQAWFQPHPPPPQPLPIPVVTAQADSTDLSIFDADLTTIVVPQHILWVIPAGADNFYLLDVSIKNKSGKGYDECSLVMEYSGPKVRGHRGFSLGRWPDFYDEKKGLPWFFSLPPDPTFRNSFVSIPDPDELRQVDAARVKLTCTKPVTEISPWHDVDVSRARWH
jgi:hypothetical protein